VDFIETKRRLELFVVTSMKYFLYSEFFRVCCLGCFFIGEFASMVLELLLIEVMIFMQNAFSFPSSISSEQLLSIL